MTNRTLDEMMLGQAKALTYPPPAHHHSRTVNRTLEEAEAMMLGQAKAKREGAPEDLRLMPKSAREAATKDPSEQEV